MHLCWQMVYNCNVKKYQPLTEPCQASNIGLFAKMFNGFLFCNRDCPKYEDILPKGICHKYLKTNRIAQTAKIMERKNKDLFGFYDVGFKFIQLWFTEGTPKKSVIKKWLGEWFQDLNGIGAVLRILSNLYDGTCCDCIERLFMGDF